MITNERIACFSFVINETVCYRTVTFRFEKKTHKYLWELLQSITLKAAYVEHENSSFWCRLQLRFDSKPLMSNSLSSACSLHLLYFMCFDVQCKRVLLKVGFASSLNSYLKLLWKLLHINWVKPGFLVGYNSFFPSSTLLLVTNLREFFSYFLQSNSLEFSSCWKI